MVYEACVTEQCGVIRSQVRDFYAIELKGTPLDNPGWDDAVCGVLGALARLVGKKAQHVPQALQPKQIAAMAGAVDVKNPTLCTIGAYVVAECVTGDRAEVNVMLDWKEVRLMARSRTQCERADRRCRALELNMYMSCM